MASQTGRLRRRSRTRRREQHRELLVVHPDFYRHLLLVCLAVIFSWGLPGALVQLNNVGALYLTVLLGLRLGPLAVRRRSHARFHPASSHTHYLLLGIASIACQLLWLFSPTTLRMTGMPLLGVFTLFIAWSMVRLLRVLARERHIDGRMLSGATAGYLLLGISGGLVLTVLDSVMPGGFHDVLSGEVLTMPQIHGFSSDRIAWDQNYGRLNYFAFVSLTTLGFGDITPVVPATRLACLTLSVLGPLYIAVVLGLLISRFTALAGAQQPPWPPAASQDSTSLSASAPKGRHPGDPPGSSAAEPPDRSPSPAPPDPGPDASVP